MTFERGVARAFAMDDETWMRHANPWSVWTRVATLPFLILAIWSRVWLGWWALIPVSVVVLWIWLNPRLFPKPRSTDNWGAKGVLGERVWLNRDRISVPMHHRVVPRVLTVISAVGTAFVVWGLVALDLWLTVFGTAITYFGKLWFVDRMVWLYQDMKDIIPEYRKWLY